jgi:hypothetical protein
MMDVPTFKIKYAGAKSTLYEGIVKELCSSKAVQELIASVLKMGALTIRTASNDDTRYDRKNRTIYVSSKKEAPEAAAAILFELNNANSAYTFTDAAEKALEQLTIAGDEITLTDFLYIATEAEKDEYVSLVHYRNQVEGLSSKTFDLAVLRDKYIALDASNPQTFYDAYVQQNLSSGHTYEMAEAYYVACYRVIPTEPWPKQLKLTDVNSKLTKSQPKFDPAL